MDKKLKNEKGSKPKRPRTPFIWLKKNNDKATPVETPLAPATGQGSARGTQVKPHRP